MVRGSQCVKWAIRSLRRLRLCNATIIARWITVSLALRELSWLKNESKDVASIEMLNVDIVVGERSLSHAHSDERPSNRPRYKWSRVHTGSEQHINQDDGKWRTCEQMWMVSVDRRACPLLLGDIFWYLFENCPYAGWLLDENGTWPMTSCVDIPAWINTNRASDDHRTGQRDVQECPRTWPIWRRPNTSSRWSYNEASEAKIPKLHFPFSYIFNERD